VDGICARRARRLEHGVHVQVRAAQRDDLVGRGRPPGTGLVVGHEGQGRDAELAARARDAHDQLASIGHQQPSDTSRLPNTRLIVERGRIDLDARAHLDRRQLSLAQPALNGARAHAKSARGFTRSYRLSHEIGNVAFVALSVNATWG